jgi:hypothetical protein
MSRTAEGTTRADRNRLTGAEAARRLGMDPKRFRERLRRSGIVPKVGSGGRYSLTWEQVQAVMRPPT